ncbi:hypothetical protein KUTeg_004348 [Tegillarca granosa]|uniref:Uncharacterized protein n=1 Tax=Tegillarca granosa TaxID=220873 RepID=A0ABQ9FTE6_TEGGR|nr:hypothetical protein KUTeg_004348 [Tegillarca granosa]
MTLDYLVFKTFFITIPYSVLINGKKLSKSSSEGCWRDPSPEQSPTLGHPRVRIRTSDPLGENFQVEDSSLNIKYSEASL